MQFKIRCSAIGDIMASPEKSELPKGAITYAENWYKEQLYSRSKEFTSKYTNKGNLVEDEAIDFIAQHFNYGYLVKNIQRFENDFCVGTPDVLPKDEVIDNKSSWDCFTFPLFDAKIDKGYWWQLQGYMWLTNRKKSKLIYTLMDMPPAELEKLYQSALFLPENKERDVMEVFEAVRAQHSYSHLPANLRIKSFSFERDDEAIKQIEARVVAVRKYLESIKLK